LSARPTVLIYARGAADYQAILERFGTPARLLAASDPASAERLAPEADILFSWRFPRELYAKAPRLRWVQCMGAGVEDIVAAELPRGVLVTRIVDQFGGMIAEYVFAELLARARRSDVLGAQQRERRWQHLVAGTLAGSCMGVAGLGSVGKEIVRKARAFDMRVYGMSRPDGALDLVDRAFEAGAWTDFVRDLDVLVLTLPLTAETEGSVGREVFRAMRPTATVVNVGRGKVVREAELIAALEAGEIGGAVLDVFEREPLPQESPLWSMPGVTVTPHVAGPSLDEDVARFFHENLERYLAARPLVGVVDRRQGY